MKNFIPYLRLFVAIFLFNAISCNKSNQNFDELNPLKSSITTKDINIDIGLTIPKGTIIREFQDHVTLELPKGFVISGMDAKTSRSFSSLEPAEISPGGGDSGPIVSVTCVCTSKDGQCYSVGNDGYVGCITKTESACSSCKMTVSTARKTSEGTIEEIKILNPTIYNYKESTEFIDHDKNHALSLPFITEAMLDNPLVIEELTRFMTTYNDEKDAQNLRNVPTDKLPKGYRLHAIKIMGHFAVVALSTSRMLNVFEPEGKSLSPEEVLPADEFGPGDLAGASCKCIDKSGSCDKKQKWIPIAGTVYWCQGSCNGCTLTIK